MDITQRISPNQASGRQGQTPDFIVCHITGASFTSAINTILNRNNQVSYHFVIAGDGTLVQAVSVTNTAWANGTTNSGDNRDNRHSTIPEVRQRRLNANLFTTSIGFADSTNGALTQIQLSKGIDLIRHIRSEVKRVYSHDIPISRSRIIGHYEINPITKAFCPGPRFPFDEILQRLLEKEPENIARPITPPSISIPATSLQPSTWAAEAWAWGQSQGLTDGTNPQNPPTREQMMTLLHRYHKTIA